MDRKKFGAVLDEAVNQLESDVRILKNQQVNLNANLKDLEEKRNKLSQEIIDATKKLDGVEKEYKDKVDTMLKTAQEKVNVANKKDAEVSEKIMNLDKKLIEAGNLIKSNKGLQNNLIAENDRIKNNISKLENLISLIGKTIKDIK